MATLFAALDPELLRTNTPDVIASMMDTIRRHGVHLKGVVSTVVITTMVLEGWSTKLNPDIRVMDTLRDLLPQNWGLRVGKTLDRAFSSASLALAAI
jgi:aarF domain-containing kinase